MPQIHFDSTVSFGTVLTIASMIIGLVAAYSKGTKWLGIELTKFEMTLNQHATQLQQQTERMDRYEERYVTIAAHLQRIIGRIEEQDRISDTPWPRNRRKENGR